MRLAAIGWFVCAGCWVAGCGSETKEEAGMSPDRPREEVTASTAAGAPENGPAGGRIPGVPAGWEVAGKGTYAAVQKDGVVTVTARGTHPTAGYQARLMDSPLRIWPPQWVLIVKRPAGMAVQVLTDFEVTASFKATEPVRVVVVTDGAGRHEVRVEGN